MAECPEAASVEGAAKEEVAVPQKNGKKAWLAQEDAILLDTVTRHGAKQWKSIAKLIPNRTEKQCRERWCNHVNPEVKKGKWTLEEDQTILRLYQQYGKRWATIARHMKGRTDCAIKNRFRRHLAQAYPELVAPSTPVAQMQPQALQQRILIPQATAGATPHIPVAVRGSPGLPTAVIRPTPADNGSLSSSSLERVSITSAAAGHNYNSSSSSTSSNGGGARNGAAYGHADGGDDSPSAKRFKQSSWTGAWTRPPQAQCASSSSGAVKTEGQAKEDQKPTGASSLAAAPRIVTLATPGGQQWLDGASERDDRRASHSPTHGTSIPTGLASTVRTRKSPINDEEAARQLESLRLIMSSSRSSQSHTKSSKRSSSSTTVRLPHSRSSAVAAAVAANRLGGASSSSSSDNGPAVRHPAAAFASAPTASKAAKPTNNKSAPPPRAAPATLTAPGLGLTSSSSSDSSSPKDGESPPPNTSSTAAAAATVQPQSNHSSSDGDDERTNTNSGGSGTNSGNNSPDSQNVEPPSNTEDTGDWDVSSSSRALPIEATKIHFCHTSTPVVDDKYRVDVYLEARGGDGCTLEGVNARYINEGTFLRCERSGNIISLVTTANVSLEFELFFLHMGTTATRLKTTYKYTIHPEHPMNETIATVRLSAVGLDDASLHAGIPWGSHETRLPHVDTVAPQQPLETQHTSSTTIQQQPPQIVLAPPPSSTAYRSNT